MKKNDLKNVKVLDPKNQLQLFGFEDYFHSFIKLYKKNKLPNTILFNGSKGIGKSTFAYHFINFMLSGDEEYKYSVENFLINYENRSYKSLCNNTHPNFFLLDSYFYFLTSTWLKLFFILLIKLPCTILLHKSME